MISVCSSDLKKRVCITANNYLLSEVKHCLDGARAHALVGMANVS